MNLNVFRVCLFELQFRWYTHFPALTYFSFHLKARKSFFFSIQPFLVKSNNNILLMPQEETIIFKEFSIYYFYMAAWLR